MPDTARFWFTMHWPHPQEASEDFPWSIYLQHEFQEKGNQFSLGDKVVFYETGRGRPHKAKDGIAWIKLKPGRQSVICIAEVSGPIQHTSFKPTARQYADGAKVNWAWEIPCNCHKEGKAGLKVEYGDVLTILNRRNVRIRSGLTEISASQYREFCRHLGV